VYWFTLPMALENWRADTISFVHQTEWCFGVDDCGLKASHWVASYLPSLPFVITASGLIFYHHIFSPAY
jgi:hypothetical protein